MKGVLLIAIGNSFYGKMAVNLAATIKSRDPHCPIHLVFTDEAIQGINSAKIALFDSMAECPVEAYMTNGVTEFIKAKTWIYDLSPFKETLFLDADMAWMASISPIKIIEQLSAKIDGEWTIQNTGKADNSVWCDLKEVKQKYGDLNGWWNFHSEFIYFRKTRKARTYFNKVKKLYEDPGLNKMTVFGGARLADELAFQLASIETGQYPHKEWFTPIFWFARYKDKASLPAYKLKPEYLGYSVGGNRTPSFVRQQYDTIVAAAFSRLGLQYPFKLKDKVYFIGTRKQI